MTPNSLLHNFLSTSLTQIDSGFLLSKIENKNIHVFQSIYSGFNLYKKWQANTLGMWPIWGHLWSTDLLQDGLLISRLRRRPDIKKSKILDKRWWNVKRHRISHYSNWNQCKVLCISIMLFVKTRWNRCFRWCLRTFRHRLSRICIIFKLGLLLSRDMMVGDTGIMRTLRTANGHVKGQGLTQKFLSNEHSFQHVFI